MDKLCNFFNWNTNFHNFNCYWNFLFKCIQHTYNKEYNQENLDYLFKNEGNYEITLRVTDNDGETTLSGTLFIFVNAKVNTGASEDNERNYYKIKDNHGNDIVIVQIAGLVARRIVCETNKNQTLNQGDRIGMIRFGSRADVYYENYEPLVKIGQTAISGETLLAKK